MTTNGMLLDVSLSPTEKYKTQTFNFNQVHVHRYIQHKWKLFGI